MDHGDTFPLGHCGDQQARQSHRPDLPAAPRGALDIGRAPPVFIMGGEPFVADVAISP
jgi:hypothetical protein